MLSAFYTAFSPACFALLGLWMVVVQLRISDWKKSDDAERGHIHQKRSYAVALHFALPGIMSLLALVNPLDPLYWQVSFVIIAFGGAAVMYFLRGRIEDIPVALDRAVHGAGIVLYLLIGILAIPHLLRVEAILLTILVLLGFNVAWLLLYTGLPRNFGASTS
jgi:hypothetical protein